MDAIVTLLNDQQNRLVEEIWDGLHQECGLRAIELTPIPHFSWSVAEGYDRVRVGQILETIAASAAPFSVRTGGAGIFLNPDLTLFLPVVKNHQLLDLHEKVWLDTLPTSRMVKPYYSPEFWMPHITLAQHDLTDRNIGCAIKELTRRVLDWELSVDNLAIICQSAGEVGSLRSRYSFSG